MKNFQNALLVLFFATLSFPHLGSSPNNLTTEINYEVSRVYSPVSITEQKLKEAQTLTDIHPNYEADWVSKYISVDIFASHKGKIKKASSTNATLSQAQKDLMTIADVDKEVSVKVHYLPKNTLAHNDVKEIAFTFKIDPKHDATYYGGQQQLQTYLQKNALDKIPNGSLKDNELAAVKFTINEEGAITNAHVFDSVFQSTKNEKVEKLLLAAVCDMPTWKPAEYANGTTIPQEFAFMVGDMESCMVNLLHVRKY